MSAEKPKNVAVEAMCEAPVTADIDSPLVNLLKSGLKDGAERVPTIAVATLVGISSKGQALVWHAWCADTAFVEARSCVAIGQHDVGSEVVIAMAGSDVTKPIVIGLIRDAVGSAPGDSSRSGPSFKHIEVDGDRVLISAEREITLKCGDSSLTLTREGKLLLRGSYISSRSSGVNRVKGASVEIN